MLAVLLFFAQHITAAEASKRAAASAESTASARAGGRHPWHHDRLSADFFGVFSEGESTFSEDAVMGSVAGARDDGFRTDIRSPYTGQAEPAEFFHESPSGGPEAAWQTHYPSAPKNLRGKRDSALGLWTKSPGGNWVQDYAEQENAPRLGNWLQALRGARKTPAAWFESSVAEHDTFGRKRLPYVSWRSRDEEERTTSGTLSCGRPGCKAETQMNIHGSGERAAHCRLDFRVASTDFDAFDGSETLEWIQVNGVNVSVDCNPRSNATGCKLTGGTRLFYPCLSDFIIDDLLYANGHNPSAMTISAKISDHVDECPYRGNMLHAIPRVKCMMSSDYLPGITNPHKNVPVPAHATWHDIQNVVHQVKGGGGSGGSGGPEGSGGGAGEQEAGTITIREPNDNNAGWTLQALYPLQCIEKGCEINTTVHLRHPVLALKPSPLLIDTCTLTVKVNQTDFDNSVASGKRREEVEWITAEGNQIGSAIVPGNNACQAQFAGAPLGADTNPFVAISSVDVTDDIADNSLVVAAKISDLVDECPSQGFLFDAMVQVDCKLRVNPMKEHRRNLVQE